MDAWVICRTPPIHTDSAVARGREKTGGGYLKKHEHILQQFSVYKQKLKPKCTLLFGKIEKNSPRHRVILGLTLQTF